MSQIIDIAYKAPQNSAQIQRLTQWNLGNRLMQGFVVQAQSPASLSLNFIGATDPNPANPSPATSVVVLNGVRIEETANLTNVWSLAAGSTDPRIDLCCVYFPLETAGVAAQYVVVQGTPSATPVVPALPSTYYYPLAQVAVAANATAIPSSALTLTPPSGVQDAYSLAGAFPSVSPTAGTLALRDGTGSLDMYGLYVQAGGTLAGTFTGSPTFTGALTFEGTTTFANGATLSAFTGGGGNGTAFSLPTTGASYFGAGNNVWMGLAYGAGDYVGSSQAGDLVFNQPTSAQRMLWAFGNGIAAMTLSSGGLTVDVPVSFSGGAQLTGAAVDVANTAGNDTAFGIWNYEGAPPDSTTDFNLGGLQFQINGTAEATTVWHVTTSSTGALSALELQFYSYALGAPALMLNMTTGAVATLHNLLDDGSGNLTAAGDVTAQGALTAAQLATLNGGAVLPYSALGVRVGAAADFNGATYGLGIAAPASSSQAPFGVLVGGGTAAVAALAVSAEGAVTAGGTTLNDGSGNATVPGNTTVEGALNIGPSGTGFTWRYNAAQNTLQLAVS